MTDDELLARCRDDIDYLGAGHRPGSAADAIGVARDYRELVRRFESLKAIHVRATCIENPQTRAWAAFDEWCHALGKAADDDYSAVPYAVLAEWFGQGESIDVAVGKYLDYRMSHPS